MKLSKKILSLLLAASLVLSSGMVLAAANGQNPSTGTTGPANPDPDETELKCPESEDGYHVGTPKTVSQEATCSDFGVVTLDECEACHKKLVPIIVKKDKDNHPANAEMQELPYRDSTCTDTGNYETFHCDACGEYYTKDKDGNPQYVEVEDPRDLANTEGVVIAMKAHDYDTEQPIYKKKTFACAFEVTYKCKNCTSTKVVRIAEDPDGELDQHTPVTDAAVEPTCLETGLTEGSHCSVCGITIVAQKTLPATDHKFGEWEMLDVTEEGLLQHKGICQNESCKQLCRETLTEDCYDTEPVYTAATCLEDAFWTHTCDKCGRKWETTDEENPATGHTWVERENLRVLPTCTINEERYYICSVCDEEKTEITFADGHKYDRIPTDTDKEPTCTEIGYEEMYLCTVCGEPKYVGEKPMLAHDFTKKVIDDEHLVSEATCTEAAVYKYECTVCGTLGGDDDTFEYGDKLGHDEVDLIGYPADYHKLGITDGKHCNRCGIDTVPQEVIPYITEKLDITYTLTGLNGDTKTASSGTAVLEIRATSEHACLFGLQLELGIKEGLKIRSYDDEHLPGFANFAYTEVEAANNAGVTKLILDAAPEKNVEFSGEDVLLARIVFDVDDTFTGMTGVSVISGTPSRQADLNNKIDVDFGTGAEIQAVLLGDANRDGITDINDLKDFNSWDLARGEDAAAYDSVFDFNDDGIVDGLDFIMMRKAIVAA